MRALFVIGLLAFSACDQVDEPICAYSCGPSGACPNDYECRADNYCHKVGTTAACEYPDIATAPDMSVVVDMTEQPDGPMSMADAGPSSDM